MLPLRQCVLFRPLPDHHDVRRVLHDATRERDRIFDVLESGHRAGAEPAAIHDGSIELDRTGGGEDRPFASVEQRVILENPNRRFDGIETRAATLEDRVSTRHGEAQRRDVRGFTLRRHVLPEDGTGATMNDERDWRCRRAILGGRERRSGEGRHDDRGGTHAK
jgi:hypothetical protein